MSFNLESARVRVGLESTDTSKDPQLIGSLNSALAIAENYTDRKFIYKRETARFYYDSSNRYTLKRYPINEVYAITDSDGNFPEYKVHKLFGRIELERYNPSDELIVDYAGGYAVLPADLELALWGIFDSTFTTIDKAMSGDGITDGAGTGYGDIQSINIPDVGTVSFASTSSSTTTSAVAAHNALWGRMGPFFMLLDSYKDHSC